MAAEALSVHFGREVHVHRGPWAVDETLKPTAVHGSPGLWRLEREGQTPEVVGLMMLVVNMLGYAIGI